MDEKCPHCQKKKPKQHQRFCPKNANRVSGPGRPKAAPQAVASNGNDGVGVAQMIEADIGIETTEREPEAMPNLEPEPTPIKEEPKETIQASVVTPVLVEALCATVEAAIKANVPEHLPPGCPPMPSPISDGEKTTLTAVATPVVAKYLPMLDAHPELALLAVGAMIFLPRMLAAKKVAAWCEANKNRPQPKQEPLRPPPPAAAPILDDAALLALGDRSLAGMSRLGQT